jgi:Dolichyl-phosphate-mannose-protein mannosyltransferase
MKTTFSAYRRQELGARFEHIAHHVTNNYRYLVLVAIAAIYLIITVQLARAKLIWTDEFFTLYLSRLNFRELWSALLTGGDQHPPPFYLLHHFFLSIFGENSWALRVPPLLGFLLMMLSVYWFVATRTSPVYGIVAMILPLVTTAHDYSYEARGYSPAIGFLALASVCWQQAGEKRRSVIVPLGLAIALMAAVTSHYYSILLLPALAAAEVVRSFRLKSFSLPVWLAMFASIIPLLAFFPLLEASSRFAGTFWAKASLLEIHLFYKSVLAACATCLLCGLAVAGLYRMVFDQRGKAVDYKNDTLPVDEIVLGAALAAAPFIVYIFGKVVTGVFAWRYALGGIVGLAILFGFFCFRFFRGRRGPGLLLVLVTLGYFVVTGEAKRRSLEQEERDLTHLSSWLARKVPGSERLVLGDTTFFYQLSYYGPPGAKRRYIYLADPARSLHYLHHDTVDRSLLALNPWFGLNVQPYESFFAKDDKAMVWSGVDAKWNWLPSALIDDGAEITLNGRIAAGMLFAVQKGKNESAPGAASR